MRSNLVVQAVVVVLLVAAVGVAVVRCGGGPDVPAATPAEVGGRPLAPETAAALGFEADTADDTVRTLIATVRETNLRLADLEAANSELRTENARLRDVEGGIGERVAEEVAAQVAAIREEAAAAGAERTRAGGTLFDEMRGVADRVADGGTPFPGSGPASGREDLVWIGPLGEGDGVLPWSGGPAGAVPLGTEGQEGPPPPRPVYTVPRNATLTGARAFTALVGRVPVGEQARITDPYSFKILVGRDNLAANGHEIPEIAYAVASGQSIGDWTLGCVSGDVTSMTFVFADGRIATIPRAEDVSDGGGGSRQVRLGSLSDDWGNPCVAGRRVTNAATYLAQSAAALTLGAAAEGAAAAQTASVAGAGGTGAVTVVDGDVGRYAAGKGLAGAAEEVARWVLDRSAQEYDVVYVPPGARVAVHVDEELRIDYDPAGRMVDHEDAGRRTYRALD